jgi:hypothetical protein
MSEAYAYGVLLWFIAAVALEVVSSLAFMAWLRWRGVKYDYGFAGVPGYLEWVYFKWARAGGRNPWFIFTARVLILVNLVPAVVLALPLLRMSL